ncbi:hypothetical protein SDC9_80680 [bioreactor metagenome]|uniref:Uncharacterized protein n=1 Tax=bioreactor metagenome TaxID=1076179 RepID=A0A644Z0M6_9ZZZZ
MSWDRKEDRESAQQKFRNACKAAGLSEAERQEFSKYMHNNNLLSDYMSYGDIKSLAEEWQGRGGYNPYHRSNR